MGDGARRAAAAAVFVLIGVSLGTVGEDLWAWTAGLFGAAGALSIFSNRAGLIAAVVPGVLFFAAAIRDFG